MIVSDFRLHQEPSSYIGPLNDGNGVPVEGQNGNEVVPLERRDALVVPTHHAPAGREVLTEITPKIRRTFIVLGIGYVLGGMGAICLEILNLVFSHASSLRGLWMGNVMLATGIVLIIVAGRKSQLLSPINHLLLFHLFTNSAALFLSIMELIATASCTSTYDGQPCDEETGKFLKLFMVGELNVTAVYSIIVMSHISRIKRRTEAPPPPSDGYCLY